MNADVYKAWLDDSNFAEKRARAIKTHTRQLYNILKKLLGPGSVKIQLESSQAIIEQAAALADLMRISSSDYSSFGLKTSTGDSLRIVSPVRLQVAMGWDIINAQSLKRVKLSEETDADGEGYIGRVIAVIDPGLRRCGGNERRELELVKPKIMVDFFDPAVKNRKRAEA